MVALYKRPNTSFNQLQKDTGISPRILRRHLNDLIKKGLAYERTPAGMENRHNVGRRFRSGLTKKGERCISSALWTDELDALKILRDLTTRLARDPKERERLDERRKRYTQALELETIELKDGKLTPQEIVERVVKRSKDDPLRESLKAIIAIFLQMNLLPHERSGEGFAIAILEKGSIDLIPFALLRKLGFNLREPEKELDSGFSDTKGKHILT
jgi:DNA-binding MarR family transcriptional regulator